MVYRASEFREQCAVCREPTRGEPCLYCLRPLCSRHRHDHLCFECAGELERRVDRIETCSKGTWFLPPTLVVTLGAILTLLAVRPTWPHSADEWGWLLGSLGWPLLPLTVLLVVKVWRARVLAHYYGRWSAGT